jgi:DNA-directed RNA polymerase beta subunit
MLTQKQLNEVMRAFWRERRPDFIQTESFDHFLNVRVPLLLGEFMVRFPPVPKEPVQHEVRIVGHRWRKPVTPEDPTRPLYPHECGWRKLTYCASLYVDVRHSHRPAGQELITEVIENVYVGDIPIVTGCTICNTMDDKTSAAVVNMLGGAGGNHIVEGIMDTLILQHGIASNTVVIEELRHSHGNVVLNGHIRCASLASRYQRYMFGANLYSTNQEVTKLNVRIPSTHKREVPWILVMLAFNDEARLHPTRPAGTIVELVEVVIFFPNIYFASPVVQTPRFCRC